MPAWLGGLGRLHKNICQYNSQVEGRLLQTVHLRWRSSYLTTTTPAWTASTLWMF
jgi:hypothetical protein